MSDLFEYGRSLTQRDNWDTEGARAILPRVFDNAELIVEQYQLRDRIDSSDITYNPNGTISIEWLEAKATELVNVEIGLTRYSLYKESTSDNSIITTFNGTF